jgi:tetratricopeptide (TPR) repeat protein
MMKRFEIYIFLLLLSACLAGCSKKSLPSVATNKAGKDYDAAAFNYVYVEAVKQKLMGNGADALSYFEQCIRINPESDGSYYQMAQIVIAANDVKNGKYYASKALSLDKKNIWYLMMLAGIYYQEKQLDSAILFYEKAISYYPEKEKLQLTLGNLYSENKQYDKANSMFLYLEQSVGSNETILLSAVKNLMEAGMYNEALDKTNELLLLKPEDILYNGLLAEIYSGKGDMDKALDVYSKLLEENPDNPQIQLSFADYLINEAVYEDLVRLLNLISMNSKIGLQDKVSLFVRLLDVPQFIKEYGDKFLLSVMVLEANYTDDNIVPLLRPDLLIKMDRPDKAAVRLEEIIAVQEDNYFAWEKLLFVYLQEGDYKNLMEKGGECASLFNMSFLAKVLYANGAIETGNYDIAIEELRKAEILAGDNKTDLMQILTMKADIFYRMEEYEKAFEIFERAIAIDSEDITVLNNYAYYLAEQNRDLKNAEAMAKKVIDREPENTTYLDTYAWVLYKRGKLNEAEKIMEFIVNSGEKADAEWYEHYGFILKDQKNCEAAVKMWQITLDIDKTREYLIKEIENCEQ